MPSLITSINHRGYAERLIKTYSVIQNATNKIIEEEGDPVNWNWTSHTDDDNSGNDSIADMYAKQLKVSKRYNFGEGNWVRVPGLTFNEDVSYLNGSNEEVRNFANYRVFYQSYPLILADGVIVAISFKSFRGGVMWPHPDIVFTIDVNGPKKPNRIGRDIFYLFMSSKSHGKVLPYAGEIFDKNATDHHDTCDISKTGHSCAYRIITEGKMNY